MNIHIFLNIDNEHIFISSENSYNSVLIYLCNLINYDLNHLKIQTNIDHEKLNETINFLYPEHEIKNQLSNKNKVISLFVHENQITLIPCLKNKKIETERILKLINETLNGENYFLIET